MMTTRELLELALLDAFGLLEEQECIAFEVDLAAASSGVRAQVRAEQDRIMRTELADLNKAVAEEPTEALRFRVLEAVKVSRLGDARPLSAQAVAHDAQSPMDIRVARRRLKSVAVWRAATVAFAAASVVFGWTTFQMRAEYDTLAQAQADDALFESLASEFGRQFVVDALVDPDTQRHFLRQVAGPERQVKAEAAVWVNPQWNSARFFAVSLPATKPGTTYRLAVLDENGTPIKDVLRFEFAGQLVNREVQLDMTIENPVLGIVGSNESGEDEVILITSGTKPGA